MDNVVSLVKEESARDEYGVERKTRTAREVFCDVQSATRAEFFGGGRNGLNPEKVLTMFHADYEGETIAEVDGIVYAIYRTFLPSGSDYIELYLERKGGTNGKHGAA